MRERAYNFSDYIFRVGRRARTVLYGQRHVTLYMDLQFDISAYAFVIRAVQSPKCDVCVGCVLMIVNTITQPVEN
jgi:hypothetical protein